MDYDKGAEVPTEIVALATCDVPGDWRFGRPVTAWKDGVTWRIRPLQASNTEYSYSINERNIFGGNALNATVVITGAKNCSLNGKLIDVREDD